MKKYLLLVAMDSEFIDLVDSKAFTTRALSDVTLWKKNTASKTITLAKTGVGPINAAMTLTEILLDERYDEVILLGLGGAVDPKLDVGDVVVATSVIQHDAICSFDDRTEFMACGELHLSVNPADREDINMFGNSEMNERYGKFLQRSGLTVHTGSVASGSEFVGAKSRKDEIKGALKSVVLVDMEAAAIAYICQKKKIPFSVIKTVADTLQDNITEQYKDYVSSGARKCAEIINCLELL